MAGGVPSDTSHSGPHLTARSMAQYTVDDDKITQMLLVFDRLPYDEARRAATAT
jgi:hypothetical protein